MCVEAETESTAARNMRRKSIYLMAAAVLMIILALGGLLLVDNPFNVKTISAEDADVQILETLEEQRHPYVLIEHMNLKFTGYYTVDKNGQVCSYCYMGMAGDTYIMVELPAEDDGALLEAASSETYTLTDVSVNGMISRESDVIECLADRENLSEETYMSYYNVDSTGIDGYCHDMEQHRIYYLIVLLVIVCLLITAVILRSEARMIDRESRQDAM